MYIESRTKREAREMLSSILRNLPHINTNPEVGGVPFYRWQKSFFDSVNRLLFLTSANQVGKSSIQIRKIIHWATSPHLWKNLWPDSCHNVAQFWYLYPSLKVATIEVEKKWIPEWLPRGTMKEHPQYGWRLEYDRGREVRALHFNTGVTIYFKAYSQNATDLQTGTVHYIACDEELPIRLYDELKFRTSSTNGHFSMAFTATLGQYEWECAMEKQGTPDELFPQAEKIQVSLYECLEYVNDEGRVVEGLKTPWSVEKIQDRIDSCSSEAEVQKRIFGRFVQTGSFRYADDVDEKNLVERWVFDSDEYTVYSAVDPGSGGAKGHPSGILWIAVNKDYTEGFVFLGWRGDGIATTSMDTFKKYKEVRGKILVTNQYYDYHGKDFYMIASRSGEMFEKAEKSHDIGEPILKSLLRLKALKIVTDGVYGLEQYNTEFLEGETLKLYQELRSLKDDTDKRRAKDDLIDPCRYICAKIPWNWDKIQEISDKRNRKTKKEEKTKVIVKDSAERIRERRKMFDNPYDEVQDDILGELDFWSEMMEF